MKQIIPLLVLALSSSSVYAQNEEKTITLDEVTIEGAKVITKTDGQIVYPTAGKLRGFGPPATAKS